MIQAIALFSQKIYYISNIAGSIGRLITKYLLRTIYASIRKYIEGKR